jgi:hypothetical protein
MSGRKAGAHGPATPLRISLPAALAARIAAWGEANGVPRVKGKANLSGAIAKWAGGLPEAAKQETP